MLRCGTDTHQGHGEGQAVQPSCSSVWYRQYSCTKISANNRLHLQPLLHVTCSHKRHKTSNASRAKGRTRYGALRRVLSHIPRVGRARDAPAPHKTPPARQGSGAGLAAGEAAARRALRSLHGFTSCVRRPSRATLLPSSGYPPPRSPRLARSRSRARLPRRP